MILMTTPPTKKNIRRAKQLLCLAVASHAIGSTGAAHFIVECADVLGVRTAGNDLAASLDILRAAIIAAESTTIEVLEKFEFADGIRYAMVTYRIGSGERRCIGAREVSQ